MKKAGYYEVMYRAIESLAVERMPRQENTVILYHRHQEGTAREIECIMISKPS